MKFYLLGIEFWRVKNERNCCLLLKWNVHLIKGDWKTISAKFCFLGAHGIKYFSILVNNAHSKGVFRGGSTPTSAGFPLSIRKTKLWYVNRLSQVKLHLLCYNLALKNGIVWGVLVVQNWAWSGISYDQNWSFISDGVTSIFFEPFRKSKTLEKTCRMWCRKCNSDKNIVLLSCRCSCFKIYNLHTYFRCLRNKNDGQTGVHKSSPIRSKWMTYWPM